jgi:drug/metabolite transporter (DMT)-like permease
LSNRLEWLLFVLLGFFWGSSYLFIKIGVEAGLEPFTLVSLRLLIGGLVLGAVVAIAREPLPRSVRTYGHLLVMGVLSVALPFSLITWAEQSVDSALAAILTAPVPLFVIVIAAFVLQDEPITGNRLIGLAVGFVGVVILVGFDPAQLAGGQLLAEVALIGATASYAAGGVYARRMVRGLRPMIPAVMQVTFAFAISAALALIFESPLAARPSVEAWGAVVWLGILGSGLSYLIFFRLLNSWGATRTSTVAYLIPVFGIALGAAVLAEPIDARLLLGTALVIGGIALVNARTSVRTWLTRRRDVVERGAPLEPR